MPSELLDAAHEYVARGLRVIALTGKTPNVSMHRRGLHDYLTADHAREHPVEFARCFEHPDTTGVGILTSWPLVVVDIDSPEGAANWKALAGADFIPDRWVARTRKGLHLYMATAEPTNTFKPFGADGGVDLKGDGGYVAAPPSAHPDGGRYEWLLPPGDEPMLEVPDPLARLIHARNFQSEGRATRSAQQKRVRHEPYDGVTLYAGWGFDHLIDGMATAADGNRNNYLHWAAATMAEEGALDEEFDQLRAAAIKASLTPLEVKRTIRSARRNHG